MAIKLSIESDSARRERLINESIERALQGINAAITRLSDPSDKKAVYAVLITRLQGRVSAKIRRKTINVRSTNKESFTSKFRSKVS